MTKFFAYALSNLADRAQADYREIGWGSMDDATGRIEMNLICAPVAGCVVCVGEGDVAKGGRKTPWPLEGYRAYCQGKVEEDCRPEIGYIRLNDGGYTSFDVVLDAVPLDGKIYCGPPTKS